jgi:hypothetical protein
MQLAKILMLISVLIIFMLGVIHTIYTISGRKLTPRDENLKSKMENVAPVISGETTMWKCWIGFNASHSLGLLLFGLIYGYLAIYKEELLFGSVFLLFVGFVLLSCLVVLAKLYWFSVPFRSLCISLICYLGSVVFSLT